MFTMIVGVYFYGLSAEPSSKYCETGKSGAKGSGGAASHRAQELKPTANHQNALNAMHEPKPAAVLATEAGVTGRRS